MNEVEVTWPRVLRVWWAWFWRSMLYIMLPSIVIGALYGAALAINNIPIEAHIGKMQLIGGALGVLVGIWLIRVILTKPYSGFRIALVSIADKGTTVDDRSAPQGPG